MTKTAMLTAEWICTKCGATNRKLVDDDATQARDRCVTCRSRHSLAKDERPVRWRATAT